MYIFKRKTSSSQSEELKKPLVTKGVKFDDGHLYGLLNLFWMVEVFIILTRAQNLIPFGAISAFVRVDVCAALSRSPAIGIISATSPLLFFFTAHLHRRRRAKRPRISRCFILIHGALPLNGTQ